MSVDQLEATIEAMSASERKKIFRWFDAHRHEFIPEIESARQKEIRSRLAEIESDPAVLEPFGEADLDRMIREAVHARAQKAPARRG